MHRVFRGRDCLVP
jgi:hypothetical protein